MRKLFFFMVFLIATGICAAQTRDLNGSSVSFDSYVQVAVDDLQLNFTANQMTTTTEWLDRVTLRLPATWTITSLTSTDFGTNVSGVGTNTAVFGGTGMCSNFGTNCGSGCVLVVHVDPAGDLGSQTIPWMIEGDTYGDTPDSVICSPGDPCNDYDPCYTSQSAGVAVEGSDMVTGPLPVELQTFSVE